MFVGCGSGASEEAGLASAPPRAPVAQAPSTPPSTETVATQYARQARRCLPLLGCDRRCGDGFQQADESWGVVRPWGDSALIEVTLDEQCHGEGTDRECMDVFVDPAACGGSNPGFRQAFDIEPLLERQGCGFDDERRCRSM